MGKLRDEVESSPDIVPMDNRSDEAYNGVIRLVAKHFLRVLDRRASDWEPESDSAAELGGALFAETRDALPLGLSGEQVATAAHLAYRAWKGD